MEAQNQVTQEKEAYVYAPKENRTYTSEEMIAFFNEAADYLDKHKEEDSVIVVKTKSKLRKKLKTFNGTYKNELCMHRGYAIISYC